MFTKLRSNTSAATLLLCSLVIQVSSQQQQQQQPSVIPTTNASLPITLSINPINSYLGSVYVISKIVLNATATLPPSTLNTTFKWSTKDGPIKTNPHASTINVTFTTATEHQLLKVEAFRGNATVNETGSSQLEFSVKDASKIKDIKGKVFLEHGELLNTKILLEGSPPLIYCFKFCLVDEQEPCSMCFPYMIANGTEVPISNRYLRYVGSYVLMFYVENVVNSDKRSFVIRINDSVREQKIQFAPIVGSILAVLVLLTGIGLHLHFKKSVLYTETADFEFFPEAADGNAWEEEQSFIQRVKYLLCRENSDEFGETRNLLNRTIFASDTPHYVSTSQPSSLH